MWTLFCWRREVPYAFEVLARGSADSALGFVSDRAGLARFDVCEPHQGSAKKHPLCFKGDASGESPFRMRLELLEQCLR